MTSLQALKILECGGIGYSLEEKQQALNIIKKAINEMERIGKEE